MTTYRNTQRVWYRGIEEQPGELLEPGAVREYGHLKADERADLVAMGVLVAVKEPVRKAVQSKAKDGESKQEADD